MPPSVPILMYHSIADTATSRFRRWTVAPERFAAHMEHLATSGRAPLTVERLARCLTGSETLPERPVVITFDDGYADFRTAALPVLREHGFPSTLFITAGYVGGTSEWLIREGETRRPMLTWRDLEVMAGDDLEYAAHGFSHRQLDTLRLAEAVGDIGRGREMTERRLGIPVATLAYPHGYSTPALQRAVRDLGFVAACGVEHAMSSPADNRFSLARIIVEADTDASSFAGLVMGRGLAMAPRPAGIARTAWRWVRRTRLAARIDTAHVPTPPAS
jgi:peptidoglycan/xylan/chitin deacetylase (PgdA/CDA1 family)